MQVTESRVFALSESGRVYVIPAQAGVTPAGTAPPPTPSSSSTSRWGLGWIWGDEAVGQHAEIVPAQKLARGERCASFPDLVVVVLIQSRIASIAAGRDHLLALTSSGRTFVHPITKNANSHGQLGFRKFDIPDPSSTASRLHVELTPRAIADPYAQSSRYARETPLSAGSLLPVSENLVDVDDVNIKFSDGFFEVPALRGVNVVQIAACARSSFVRTDTGRVLGWGANDYGYVIRAP